VSQITEVQRMESDVITLQNLFEFKLESIAADRTITGGVRPTGLRPMFLHKFEKRGMELSTNLFTAPPPALSEIARGQR
jgi:pilus assembly protein CpaF